MARSQDALIGRDVELEQLDALLTRACDGEPSFTVVTGEAGIGKTRLLQELSRSGSERGCLTLEGRAAEYERELPFGLFVDALDSYLAALESHLLDRLAMDRLGALAAVFPSLQSIDHAVERPVTTTERFLVHHAVRDLIERLAAARPVVLVLDDLQWADGASLELINALLRRPPRAAVMMAMTLRLGQGETTAVQAVREIQQVPAVHNIELGPLAIRDFAELVRGSDDLDLERLHHQCGGNPFYAIQLARSQNDRGSPARRSQGGVPPGVLRSIASELNRLSASARTLAESAAVLGDPFEFDIAFATAGSSESDALEQIDELAARDLVRVTAVPRRFQFRHPLVRSAVYEAIAPGARVGYHARAATVLSRVGSSAATIANHIEQSARNGDAEACEILQRAGAESAPHAPGSAARWFAAALRVQPHDSPPEARIGLLVSLATALAAVGRFAEARDALEECVALMPADVGTDPWVGLVVGCAGLDQLLGQHRESRQRLIRAYEGLPNRRTPAGAALLTALSSADFFIGDFNGSLSWAEQAVEIARRLDDNGLLAEALAAQTMGAAWVGRIELARALQQRATALTDAMRDDELAPRINALMYLSTAELYLDLFDESCAHGERCLALARATQQTQLLPILVPILGSSLWVVGHLQRSAELLDEAIDAARLVGNTQAISFSLFDRSLSALMAGDLETALESGRESVSLAQTFERGLVSVYAGGMYALALLESGDAGAAFELLLDSGGGTQLLDFAGSWRSMFLEGLTRCCLTLGMADAAKAAATQARLEALELDMAVPAMMADHAEAAVALAEGRAADAARHALSAVHNAERVRSPVFVARACLLAGHTLAEARRPDEASDWLQRAAATFEAVGAIRDRDRVDAELRRTGRTRRRPARASDPLSLGVGALSSRELEVAVLIRNRRTNREIAGELFLGIKTVETHVRNIFNKLGVTSRVEIARALEQLSASELARDPGR